MALNQRVQGSSLCAPSKEIKDLGRELSGTRDAGLISVSVRQAEIRNSRKAPARRWAGGGRRQPAPCRICSRHRRRTFPWTVPPVKITFDCRSEHSTMTTRGPQIPMGRAGDIAPFRHAVSSFGRFRTPADRWRGDIPRRKAGIRNPSHMRTLREPETTCRLAL